MAKVRVFEAAVEGFRVIRREPKAVGVWGLVLFVLIGLPTMLYLQGFSAAFLQMGELQTEEEMIRAIGPLFVALPLLIVGATAGYALTSAAVLRAVIAPDDIGYFYLRFSRGELWLVVSALVGIILAYIVAIVLLLLAAILGAVLGGLLGGVGMMATGQTGQAMSGAHWGMVLGVIAGEIGIYYVMLRFSMAPIMSFADRRFRLFEAWRFTRGEGWRIFGLTLVICLAAFALEVVFLLLIVGPSSPFWLATAGDPEAATAFLVQISALYASPWMWVAAAIGALLGGVFITLMIAPYARVYLMLRADGEAPAAEVVAAAA